MPALVENDENVLIWVDPDEEYERQLKEAIDLSLRGD